MYHEGIIYNVILLENANGVSGSVWHNSDDSYTIFIDAKLSTEKQRKVFLHEMKHIQQNDFGKYNVHEIEIRAHE